MSDSTFMRGFRRAVAWMLNETSTLRGIVVAVVAIAGWQWAPERLDAVALVAVTIGSVMKIALPDKWTRADAPENKDPA